MSPGDLVLGFCLCPGAGEGLGHEGTCSSPPASLFGGGQSQVARDSVTLTTGGAYQPEMDLSCSGVTTRLTDLWAQTERQVENRHLSPPADHLILRPGITHTGCRHCWDAQGPACPDLPSVPRGQPDSCFSSQQASTALQTAQLLRHLPKATRKAL